jgi:low temperature requirement protein LtrA
MSTARKLLIFGGTVLAAVGMLYGLHYAIFVEHQTLDRMGGSLASAFVHAAERRPEDSQLALIAYRESKYDYVRQVDVHSHWIGLAMLMIVLGVVFDEVALGERARFAIALAMLVGAIVFPLGVILQTARMALQTAQLGSALAIAGSALVIVALGATAVGFMRGDAK